MKKIQKLGCLCEKPELNHTDYRSSEVGTVQTNGKKIDVSILQCKLCQRIWIKYCVEFENSPDSGRWYKGIITKKDVTGATVENALDHLENMDWYLYGGDFFGNTGTFGQGKLNVDI